MAMIDADGMKRVNLKWSIEGRDGAPCCIDHIVIEAGLYE